MALSTFRYQIVYRVNDKSGAVIMNGVEVLPDGATPPVFKIGDNWRVELANGKFIEGTIYFANNKIMFADPHNWIIQYDFGVQEV